MTKKAVTLIAMVCVSAASGAWAEDLTSAEKILCTSVEATVCYADGDCEFGPPWNWGVPQFIEIDFQTKQLSTTKASHERRASPFKNEQRSEGLIFLQGVENCACTVELLNQQFDVFGLLRTLHMVVPGK